MTTRSPISLSDPTAPLFFFSSRRRHTRCGRDWSSDVCSSDLGDLPLYPLRQRHATGPADLTGQHDQGGVEDEAGGEIGRASCRERVEIAGVVEAIKKKKQQGKYNRRQRSSDMARIALDTILVL